MTNKREIKITGAEHPTRAEVENCIAAIKETARRGGVSMSDVRDNRVIVMAQKPIPESNIDISRQAFFAGHFGL